MSNLSDAQRVALASVIQYYFVLGHKKGNPPTRAGIADAAGLKDIVDDKKHPRKLLDNFLASANKLGADKLCLYFTPIIEKDAFYNNAPAYIKIAIDSILNKQHEQHEPEHYINILGLSKIIDRIAQKDPSEISNVSDVYSGVWSGIRFSAHTEQEVRRQIVNDDMVDPNVVLVGMSVIGMDEQKGSHYPSFEIKFRPLSSHILRRITGTIMCEKGGNHVHFIGFEYNSGSPIHISAVRDREVSSSFSGLLMREHERGPLFVSRIMFGTLSMRRAVPNRGQIKNIQKISI